MLKFITPLILQNSIWIPTRIVLRFFGHLEIYGLKNLKDVKGPVIFAANHSSELDPILIPASLPFFSKFSPIFYVSREKSFYERTLTKRIFYGGTFFKLWGAYPAKVGLKNYKLSLDEHSKILKEGGSVLIFPEGRKTRDGVIQEAKGGVAYLAKNTGAPIVPVAISGVFRTSYKNFYSRKISITVTYGEPIYIDSNFVSKTSIQTNHYKLVADEVLHKVAELFENSYFKKIKNYNKIFFSDIILLNDKSRSYRKNFRNRS